MLRISNVKLPAGYENSDLLPAAAKALRLSSKNINEIKIIKRSLDARKKDSIKYLFTLDVSLNISEKKILAKKLPNVSPSVPVIYSMPERKSFKKKPVVVGFGPAGIFAAYLLAKAGAEPIVIERGEKVEDRKRSVNTFRKERVLDEESNIQFGEGGAGAFSDGKLNTGISDSRIKKVLETFVEYGGPEQILYDAKPHLGTDKLPAIIKNIREEIISLGGEFRFSSRLSDIIIENNEVRGIRYISGGDSCSLETDTVVLAIGHSARDTFRMLCRKGIPMESKPFAVGLRIEHKAELINRAQYGNYADTLPTADYKLFTHLKNGRGVYTFCMCPGGEVVGATSLKGHVVTNGMSNFARDGENSNSAVLVGIDKEDYGSSSPLAGMEYQSEIEKRAFTAGGSDYSAPTQLLGDFLSGTKSISCGSVRPTYQPGTRFCSLDSVLPEKICESIRLAIPEFASRLRGFDAPDAVLTAPETRSSSPVRILRGESMQSISVKGLYPCGEGAGYAGGITSSAVDGLKVAEKIIENCSVSGG